MQLPEPDAESAAHSQRVAEHIRDAIEAAGGQISFAEFMHHALYAPGLGYYTAGAGKFGAGGDFVTAPEVSSLFGHVLAGQCAEVLGECESGAIVEVGAGSGKLAVDILTTLASDDALPAGGYRIFEPSPDLVERQRDLLERELGDLAATVSWLSRWPAEHSGVVLANEVVDAMPVERFVKRGSGVEQICVVVDGDGFALGRRAAPDRLAAAVADVEASLGVPLADGYASEISLAAPQWVRETLGLLERGAVFLFDYGLSRPEYYAPDRSGGWLRCHFRHRAHDDPLRFPGIQDLTAWVDFSAVASAALCSGLDVLGYVTQAHFMIGGGIDRIAEHFPKLPIDAQLKRSAELKLLTLPSEMGENFKCLGLGRGNLATPSAFRLADRSATLG